MTDRIDTDAIRVRFTGAEYLSVESEDVILALCDEVDRLRAHAGPAPALFSESDIERIAEAARPRLAIAEHSVIATWAPLAGENRPVRELLAIIDRLTGAEP